MDLVILFAIGVLCVRICILVVIIILSYRLIGRYENKLAPVFFTFSMVSWLFSDLYWITYDVLRPDTRMPFAANEFGEWAIFLLLAAGVNAMYRSENGKAVREMLLAGLFVLCNVAFWIGWSGEWLEDVVTGLVFGLFVCTIVEKLKTKEILTGWEWNGLGIACLLLVLLQGATFHAPDRIRQVLDACCYVILFAGIAFFGCKTFLSLCRPQKRGDAYLLALSTSAWLKISLYQSAGIAYNAILLIDTVYLVVLFAAFRKEVAAK